MYLSKVQILIFDIFSKYVFEMILEAGKITFSMSLIIALILKYNFSRSFDFKKFLSLFSIFLA